MTVDVQGASSNASQEEEKGQWATMAQSKTPAAQP